MDVLDFNPNIIYHPDNEEQLRRLYVDQLFHFQLKWASSTMMEKSNLDANFMRDSLLGVSHSSFRTAISCSIIRS